SDETITDSTQWLEYEFKCKPGDVYRRPCVVAPYHYRLDWQIWFAAMEDPRDNPWLVHFVAKLLQGDAAPPRLLADHPVPPRSAQVHPRRALRLSLYPVRRCERRVVEPQPGRSLLSAIVAEDAGAAEIPPNLRLVRLTRATVALELKRRGGAPLGAPPS